MLTKSFVLLGVTLFTLNLAIAEVPGTPASPGDRSRVLREYGNLPLQFEANAGQVDSRVRFLSRTGNYTLFLSPDEAVLSLQHFKKIDGAKPDGPKRQQDAAAILRMRFEGRSAQASLSGADPLAGYVNYFKGNDPSKWHTNVATYSKVRYNQLYPGIDLVFYGNQRNLEYDFVAAPGAAVSSIRMSIEGADRTFVDGVSGDLVLKTGEQETRFRKPALYQTAADGTDRVEIAGRFVMHGNTVTFDTAAYDHSRPLVIDPVLAYSTYLGGNDIDVAEGVAIDSKGSAYITGWTCSANFPVSSTAYQPMHGPNPIGGGCSFNGPYLFDADVFVTKLNAAGTAIVYSTYLGGSYREYAQSIAVDKSGNAYIAGWTSSPDFPLHNAALSVCAPVNAYNGDCTFSVVTTCSANGSMSGFISKLGSAGSELLYSSFFGGTGSTQIDLVALDASNNVYVAGNVSSEPFNSLSCGPINYLYPFTSNAYDPGTRYPQAGTLAGYTAFYPALAKFDSSFNLLYATIFDVSNNYGFDYVYGLAVDSKGIAYLTGTTINPGLPVTSGVVQPTCPACVAMNGQSDAWVAAFDATKSGNASLVYSTYVGGSGQNNVGDIAYAIAVDGASNAYITGQAGSPDFPTTSLAYQQTDPKPGCNGIFPAFVTKLNSTATRFVYSTYLGGSQCGFSSNETGFAIAVDKSGNAYVSGADTDPTFPVVNPLQGYPGLQTAFVSELDPKGQHLLFSTPLGGGGDSGNGVAADSAGNVYVTGATSSSVFPTTTGAFQAAYQGGGDDGFVSKIALLESDLAITNSAPATVKHGHNLTYRIVATNNGPNTAVSAVMTDAVPRGTTFVSASTTAGSCQTPTVGSAGTVRCTVGSLANGGSFTLTMVVSVKAKSGGSVSDTVNVSALTSDPNTANNLATAVTTVN